MRAKIGAWLIGAIAALLGEHALAACNNPKDWMESPHAGVKWLLGTDRVLPESSLRMIMGGLDVEVSPFPLTKQLEAQVGKGILHNVGIDLGHDEAHILYYESDNKGGWRLCRAESWWKPRDNPKRWEEKLDDKPVKPIEERYMRMAKTNPLLSTLTAGWRPDSANILLYNAQQQLVETFTVFVDSEVTYKRYRTRCARYDEEGHQTLYDQPANEVCPAGKPDPLDFYREFKYILYKGEYVTLRSTFHRGDPSWKGWKEEVLSNQPFFWAFQDSWHGLTRFQTSYDELPLDTSKRNTRMSGTPSTPGPVQYYFPKDKVFLSDIEPDLSRIYRYDRRRETRNRLEAWDLQEYFPANSHIPRYRFQTVRGQTQRQEQLDAQGRITRIIDVGRRDKPSEPDEVVHVPWKLLGHELYYRVWDVTPEGKKTLVALGWNKSRRPWLGLGNDQETVDTVWVIYGLPDGTPKWTEDEFVKRFGYDAAATPVWGRNPSEQRKAS